MSVVSSVRRCLLPPLSLSLVYIHWGRSVSPPSSLTYTYSPTLDITHTHLYTSTWGVRGERVYYILGILSLSLSLSLPPLLRREREREREREIYNNIILYYIYPLYYSLITINDAQCEAGLKHSCQAHASLEIYYFPPERDKEDQKRWRHVPSVQSPLEERGLLL